MTKVDLGCLKLPFDGPYNHTLVCFALLWACALNVVVFNLSTIKGPAVNVANTELIGACGGTIIVTVAWCLLYYNYISVAVVGFFGKDVWEMYTGKDVTPKYGQIASRFAGNMMEHSVVFMVNLWMYTMFADYSTGWTFGVLYLSARALYPFFYMYHRQFTFWFEFCTQIGYGCCGLWMLGALVSACGGDWAQYATDNPIVAPVLGFLVGSFALLPGIPFAPIYAFIHYKMDNKIARQAAAKEAGKVEVTNVAVQE